MKALIIDWVTASWKSTIIWLLKHTIISVYPNMTSLFISEHYTQRMLEHKKEVNQLKIEHILQHTNTLVDSLSQYQKMLELSKFSLDPKWADFNIILERSIFSLLCDLPVEISSQDEKALIKLLKRINKLGMRWVFFYLDDNILSNRILSTRLYRNGHWREYLNGIGNDDDIVQYFINRQSKLLTLLNKYQSYIDSTIINIDNNSYDEYAKKLFTYYK